MTQKTKRRWISRTLAAALIASLLTACGHQSGTNSTGPLKLGFVGSLTGGTADYGIATLRGVELAIKEFNDAGGYKGQKVDLVKYDDEAKPQKAVESVNKLISSDGVATIIGPINSGNSLATIDLAQSNKVPMMLTVPSTPEATARHAKEAKHYIFRVSMRDDHQVQVFVDYLTKTRGFKRIGVLHDTTGYGAPGAKTVIDYLTAQGIKPVAVASWQVGDTDMTAQINQMKAANVEAIALFGVGPELAQMFKTAQRLNYREPVFAGPWTLSQPIFTQLMADLLKENYFKIYAVQSFTPEQSDVAKKWFQKITTTYDAKDIWPVVSAQAYDGTRIILEALKQVGPDREKLRDAIEGLSGFQPVTGIDSKPFGQSHDALTVQQMFLAQWEKGQLVKVK